MTIDSLAGVTGTVHVRTPGLVGATPVSLTLQAGPFDPEHPATSTATAAETLVVRPGSRAARFQVISADAVDDLDLYVYRDGVLVASATDGSGDETVTMTRPPAGTYQIYVNAQLAAGASASADLHQLGAPPRSAAATCSLDHRSIGVNGGERFSVTGPLGGSGPATALVGLPRLPRPARASPTSRSTDAARRRRYAVGVGRG